MSRLIEHEQDGWLMKAICAWIFFGAMLAMALYLSGRPKPKPQVEYPALLHPDITAPESSARYQCHMTSLGGGRYPNVTTCVGPGFVAIAYCNDWDSYTVSVVAMDTAFGRSDASYGNVAADHHECDMGRRSSSVQILPKEDQ